MVSCIIAAYNVEDYIEDCIQSLVRQTYNDIEIIVVNDGSKDKTHEKCIKASRADKRIKVISTLNKGVSCARNRGLQEASGEWVTFIDGDDYCAENMVQILSEKCKESSDCIWGGYFVDKKNKCYSCSFFDDNYVFGKSDKGYLIKLCVGVNLNGLQTPTNIGVPWGKLYRRDFLVNNNIKFVPGLKRMQDMIFNIEVISKAHSIEYVNQPIYYYRRRSDSATQSNTSDFTETAKEILNQLESRLEKIFDEEEYRSIIDFKVMKLLSENIRLQYNPTLLGLRKFVRSVSKLCVTYPYCRCMNYSDTTYFSKKMILVYHILKARCYVLAFCMYVIKNFEWSSDT